jgi:alkyldihydroxyacetonephosphate synthase
VKRWNGWGDPATTYPLLPSALDYLGGQLGVLRPGVDAALVDILPAVPETRLPRFPGVDLEAETRLRYARGQSLPDWVALRSGRIPVFPDGVAFPESDEEVRAFLDFARRSGVRLIPYGGGTSVVGHINPLQVDAPVLTLSLEKLNRLLDLDETSHLATIEAGVLGPHLEAQLKARGYTLGHFPQSFEFSTLGGWIATRSSGQQSYYYGRIEDLFAGGRLETPRGRLELPGFPASAAGPDLRHIVLGSEGRLGVITQAKLRVRRLPEVDEFYGVFFPSWEQGTEATRSAAQQDLPVSMLRLSNPLETETTLKLSGKSWIDLAERGLRLVGYQDQRCLLIFGATGSAAQVRRVKSAATSLFRRYGGLPVGRLVGRTWQKSRFLSPYLRNTLWERGAAVDTLETALPWAQVQAASTAILRAIREAAQVRNARVLAFAHLSHVYRDGASIYVTYLFHYKPDPEELLDDWRSMKQAASLTIQQHGGTISHQHGVGLDHAPYLPAEKGALGLEALQTLCQVFDPDGMMNPGKLCAETL